MPPPANDEEQADEQSEADATFELSLVLTERQIEAMWSSLTPLQRANGLQAALQTEPETLEATDVEAD